MKTEKKHQVLCEQLPYGLKARYTNKWNVTDTFEIKGTSNSQKEKGDVYVELLAKYKSAFFSKIDGVKLILHEMDLTKEITIGGETFVPIVELSKHFCNVGKCEIFKNKGEEDIFGWDECNGDDYSGYAIIYNPDDFGFYVCYSEDVTGMREWDSLLWPVEAKHIVYDLLNIWHFNWRNLPESEYIKVSSLPKSPYA